LTDQVGGHRPATAAPSLDKIASWPAIIATPGNFVPVRGRQIFT